MQLALKSIENFATTDLKTSVDETLCEPLTSYVIHDSRLINEAEAIAVKIQDFKRIPTSYVSYHA